ncbi:hypothetical protein BU17DRAFT_69577 [Hysterangium stoloniferum]|nr:hypothetical protein BU17DRAFT_69577 [Hysterangium stoloniferum]
MLIQLAHHVGHRRGATQLHPLQVGPRSRLVWSVRDKRHRYREHLELNLRKDPESSRLGEIIAQIPGSIRVNAIGERGYGKQIEQRVSAMGDLTSFRSMTEEDGPVSSSLGRAGLDMHSAIFVSVLTTIDHPVEVERFASWTFSGEGSFKYRTACSIVLQTLLGYGPWSRSKILGMDGGNISEYQSANLVIQSVTRYYHSNRKARSVATNKWYSKNNSDTHTHWIATLFDLVCMASVLWGFGWRWWAQGQLPQGRPAEKTLAMDTSAVQFLLTNEPMGRKHQQFRRG